MNAHDSTSRKDSGHTCRPRPFHPLRYGQVEDLSDKALTARPQQHGIRQGRQFAQVLHDIDVLFKSLSKTDARIGNDLVLTHPGPVGNHGRTNKEALHIAYDVAVFRAVLVVHDDDGDAVFCSN